MTNPLPLPPQDELRELLTYEPDTGLLRWKARDDDPAFNARFAGQPALNTKKRSGHREGLLQGRYLQAHRVIWKLVVGEDPKGVIDHIDGDPFNNRWSNLRDCTMKINQRNQRLPSNNKTGVCGLTVQDGRYFARVCREYLGTFPLTDEGKVQAIKAIGCRRSEIGGFTERHGQPCA